MKKTLNPFRVLSILSLAEVVARAQNIDLGVGTGLANSLLVT